MYEQEGQISQINRYTYFRIGSVLYISIVWYLVFVSVVVTRYGNINIQYHSNVMSLLCMYVNCVSFKGR